MWEYTLINKRVELSGMNKKDFFIRSCINSHICVVGSAENVKEIVNAVYEMQRVIKELVCQMKADKLYITDSCYRELEKEIFSMCITIIEILDGAAYLFDKKPQKKYDQWKAEYQLEEFRKMLEKEYQQEV